MPAKKGEPHRPAHAGSAYRDKRGYWCARLRHGDRLFTATTKAGKAAALRLVRAKHAQWLRDGRAAEFRNDRTTVAVYLERFLAAVGRERKPATKGGYARALAHAPDWLGRVRLVELRPAHVDRAQAELAATGASTATLRRLHTVLVLALRRALREEPDGWRNLRVVLDAARAPRHVPAERPHADAAQMLALLAALEGEEPYRTAVALCCYCGLRVGEVLGLRWGDLGETSPTLRLERQSLHDTRALEELKHARQRRTMTLPAPLVPVLAAHRDRQRAKGRGRPHDLLFPGGDYARSGLPLSHKAVYVRVAAAEGRAGLPAGVALHGLRHGHATLALEAGATVKDVQERLGHADLATTARYLHRAATGDKAVAARVGRALRAR